MAATTALTTENTHYDIVVIGAGHAGCEAALVPARMGLRTAVVTLRQDRIAFMPCNPAIGGLGKGHLVREIDALGGEMGRAIDATGIQFRLLNRSKGPAVWSPRAQADKALYAEYMRYRLLEQSHLDIIEGSVGEILVAETSGGLPRLCGVRLESGKELRCKALIITTGTFLSGLMHMGRDQIHGGRSGEAAPTKLSQSFRALGFRLGRLKTGTPPRLLRDSIDFGRFEEQPGDEVPRPFSYRTDKLQLEQVSCYLAQTTEEIHRLIRDNLHLAPMYNGQVESSGPRYCPSIEDKVVRFAERRQHHLFLEPEGRNSPEVYVNGLSTSLPREVQREIIRRLPGLAEAEIVRYGYAVEYDYVVSGQLHDTLESKAVRGLYLAGQINGTSGYEEAAAQGLMAAINAAAAVVGLPPFVLERSEAYIGVMTDDLAHMNLTEPYRMFTSRAEYRLQLRVDNADERLMPYAERYGLLDAGMRSVQKRNAEQLAMLRGLLDRSFRAAEVEAVSKRTGAKIGRDHVTLEKLLRTPGVTPADVVDFVPELGRVHPDVLEKFEVQVRYEGYIRRQQRDVAAVSRLEERLIPAELDYGAVAGLSNEARQRLLQHRPRNLAQASRLEGVRAGDLSLLLVHIERGLRTAKAGSP